MKTALLIVNLTILNPEAFQEYKTKASKTFAEFNGKPVLSYKHEKLSGNTINTHTAIFRFPDKKSAVNWFNSSAYQELTPLRNEAFSADFLVVEE